MKKLSIIFVLVLFGFLSVFMASPAMAQPNIISPQPGTTWYTGETNTIEWVVRSNSAPTVFISLTDSFGSHEWIGFNVTNSGSYTWVVTKHKFVNHFTISIDDGGNYESSVAVDILDGPRPECDLTGELTLKVSGLPSTNRNRYYTPKLRDGNPVTLVWNYSGIADECAVTELSVIGFVDGVESWGYPLTLTRESLNSGKLLWTPRVLRVSGEKYKIRATLERAGQVITVAESVLFEIILKQPRSITITEPKTEPGLFTPVHAGGKLLVRWTSRNIPANAKLRIIAQPVLNSESGGIKLGEYSDTGGHFVLIPLDMSRGKYYLSIFYVTEYGIFGAESNTPIIEVFPDR
jgi:hypothetical protein